MWYCYTWTEVCANNKEEFCIHVTQVASECFLIDRISKPSDLYLQHYIFLSPPPHPPMNWTSKRCPERCIDSHLMISLLLYQHSCFKFWTLRPLPFKIQREIDISLSPNIERFIMTTRLPESQPKVIFCSCRIWMMMTTQCDACWCWPASSPLVCIFSWIFLTQISPNTQRAQTGKHKTENSPLK